MDGPGLPPKLLSTLNTAAERIRGQPFVHIYSHYDADGISSAAIIAKALFRENIGFQTTIFPVLDPPQMETVRTDGERCFIMTDLGASYIDQIDALDAVSVVLDHHTLGVTETKNTVYANPHLYGIDGMTSGCGATMAFLFAIALNERNWDLAPVAIAGMVGDRQHLKGMLGLNEFVFEGAKSRGLVQDVPGSFIPYGDLSTELFTCTDPYICGITGNSEGVMSLLEETGIGTGSTYESLTDEQRQKLSSIIAAKLINQGVSRDKLDECVVTRYILKDWDTDARGLSSVLDACGRNDLPSVGIAAGMGDRDSLRMGAEVDAESRRKILTGIRTAEGNLTQLENVQWFDSSESGFTGIICGVVMSYIGDPSKPTIGFNGREPTGMLSSRATFPLLEKGIDMAAAMRQACEEVGGNGGGHKIAAGGSIPRERRDDFLRTVDRIVGEQKKA